MAADVTMEPRVSIIIPCHNAARWIEETIRSALAQTWQHREIVVVDDGSADDSVAVARQFADAGVIVLQQSNRGASAARNAGFRHSRGDYIQFLDADDLLDPEKISSQLSRLRADATGQAIASARWGRFTGSPTLARFVDEPVFRDFDPAWEFLLVHAREGRMMHPAAWLVPRAVAEAAGPWNESLSLNDDGEYFARVLMRSTRVHHVAGAKTFYRSAIPSSLSKRRDRRALASLYASVDSVSQMIEGVQPSARVRQVLADYWQRTAYEFYPDAPDLFDRAEDKSKSFGRSTVRPAMGRREQRLAGLVGWKLARRLQRYLNR